MVEAVKFSKLANFTPRQIEANNAVNLYKYVLFGGAKGGGKSRWLRWELLKLLIKWGGQGLKNVRVGLFCEDYPTLKDRQISKIKNEFPKIGELKDDRAEGLSFKLSSEYGGGILALRNLDDPSKYNSSEFAAIGIDELTMNPFEVFEQLRTVLRWPGIEDVKFIAGTNPGNIGHAWVKRYWIDRDFPDEEREKNLFCFVRSLPEDNPYNSKTYMEQLLSIADPEMRKAYLEGSWEIFKGQYFSMWREQKDFAPYHVIPQYMPTEFDEIYGSMDWGFNPDSFAYHLYAVSKISLETATFIRIRAFAELYNTRLYPTDWAKKIFAMEKALLPKGKTVCVRYGDPSAWNRDPITGTSVADEFKFIDTVGRDYQITFTKANNDKLQGWTAFLTWLGEAPDGLPFFQVCDSCPNLKKQIPSMVRDKHNPNVVADGTEDHAVVAARYFLVSRPQNNIAKKIVIPAQWDRVNKLLERKKVERKEMEYASDW